MSEEQPSFGARYAALGGVHERAALEAQAGRREQFAAVDAVLDRLVAMAMGGERIAKLIAPTSKKKSDRVELLIALSEEERAALTEHFEVANQQKRGSWYIPENEALSLGLIHTLHWTRSNPRLALNLADSERATPLFRGEPEAVAVWVLEPLFEELFLPLKLRGLNWLGRRTVEQQEKSWGVIDPLYRALGLDGEALDAYRPGTGWSRHTTNNIIALRQSLVESWATAPKDVGARYRAYRLGQVIDRYYSKAKKGVALRKQVLTKPFGRTLTAYFGGDWLAFLSYLGEQAHPSEEIVQALPETKLTVGMSERTAEVAAEHGVAAEEVQRMLAAYWQQSDHNSPVEQRVDVLRRFWAEFDALHTRQTTGMPSLWGLVQQDRFVYPQLQADEVDPRVIPRVDEQLLSEGLRRDIERLWSTAILPRWPNRLVTEPAPHAGLSDAFGPALRFWEGAALTAWFLCEGPYSRTDMDGLANYHHWELDALDELGCPVDGELFRELREAEKRLKPVEPDYDTVAEHEVAPGLSISVQMSRGQEKLKGFEKLRDIITRHRRAWADQYLDMYLRSRWELEVRGVGEAYHRHAADKSKPPTLKQFAKLAAPAANEWFGGDLTGVHAVLGFKAPERPTRAPRLVPSDPNAFATRLYQKLRGDQHTVPPSWKEDPLQRERYNNFADLASLCVEYLQLEEALGERPALPAFGRQKFAYRSAVLSDDTEEAWELYGGAIHATLAEEQGAPAVACNEPAEPVAKTEGQTRTEPALAGNDGQREPLPPAAWHPDPYSQHRWRWWDGQQWTEQVSS